MAFGEVRAGRAIAAALPPRVSAALALALALVPAPAGAWGFTGHRLIARKAVATLPPEMRRAFEANVDYLVEQAITPDLDRSSPGDPDHFLDMDAFGAYPFPAISRVEAETAGRLGRNGPGKGRLPWKIDEVYPGLLDSFPAHDLPPALDPPATPGHFVADPPVPAH